MKCTPIRLPDGGTAIVCGSKPRLPKCEAEACRQFGTRQCDWKMPSGKTCDRHLCIDHAYVPAPAKDLCPEHALEWAARQKPPTVSPDC